jgi:hypothetical protein
VHPVASGAVARTFSFVPTAIASLLASRLIISHFGIHAFDGYTVAEALLVLLPLGDLGVGSAITAAFASHDPTGPEAEGVMLSATRIVSLAALFVGTTSLVLGVAGIWTTVLGEAAYGGWFFGLGMCVYAAGSSPGSARRCCSGSTATT